MFLVLLCASIFFFYRTSQWLTANLSGPVYHLSVTHNIHFCLTDRFHIDLQPAFRMFTQLRIYHSREELNLCTLIRPHVVLGWTTHN